VAISICLLSPEIRTVLSLDASPSFCGINWMRALDFVCMFLIVSPPRPIITPTLSLGTLISICSGTPLAARAGTPPASTSAMTALISFSAFSIQETVPIISTGLKAELGSASASLRIWILAPELT
jgi:hypothetical protein